MKRFLAPIFNRIGRSLGITEIQGRLDALESAQTNRRVSDELYAAIEERFRGDSALIKSRQTRYLPHVADASNGQLVLDLGFGRGEWLDLLRDHRIQSTGVDSNNEFVRAARERGLDVILGDISEYLTGRPDNSLGAVTMFQVAEHLPLGVLEQILHHAHRTLIPGGVLIVEIPNIETLRVGASTFWIDPTHERPLFPEFLVFMVERAGFSTIIRDSSTPLAPTPRGLSDDETALFERINGNADFAVIATK